MIVAAECWWPSSMSALGCFRVRMTLEPIAHVGFARFRFQRGLLPDRRGAPSPESGKSRRLQVERAVGAAYTVVRAGCVAEPHAPAEEELFGVFEQRVEGVGMLSILLPDVRSAMGDGAGRVAGSRDHAGHVDQMGHPEPRNPIGAHAVKVPSPQQLRVEWYLGSIE